MTGRTLAPLALIAALALPVAGSAKEAAARVGTFDAMGTGTLVAQGSLTVFGTIEGAVLVRDPAGTAIVRIKGVRQRPRVVTTATGAIIRTYAIRKANGSFYAKGKGIRVELRSPEVTLSVSAFGRGTITRLSGEGTYHLNDDAEQQWVDAPLPLRIKPPAPPTPEPARATAAGETIA